MGTIFGIIGVIALTYFTYLLLPFLVSDLIEHFLKFALEILSLGMDTALILIEYPKLKIAFLPIIGEGIEVVIFIISL
ncbi:hypothetical protein YN1551_0224 [Sulfolobus islandicus Y.N.15.51]|uniref:Uncharacterized protein n=1 Tax=Saccharolobus islandicus (strain Y.N.15.51 / Yellowstone \|nr:hypothetical protein YN1551_0224 [Sulfolobus islandicus Y.N.15.51]